MWLNRKRTNKCITHKRERETIVASQLLALSCFMQIPPESQTLQDFCRSLPELWLLPAVSELLRMPISPEVHIQAIHLFSGILVMMEGQGTRYDLSHNHLISSAHNLLAAWQQHGLMQTLLRDISCPPHDPAGGHHREQPVYFLAAAPGQYRGRLQVPCGLLRMCPE